MVCLVKPGVSTYWDGRRQQSASNLCKEGTDKSSCKTSHCEWVKESSQGKLFLFFKNQLKTNRTYKDRFCRDSNCYFLRGGAGGAAKSQGGWLIGYQRYSR